MKKGFLRISNSKSFHDSTAHIWTFRKLNKRFRSITKSNSGRRALPIFERLATWIRDSWTSVNPPHSRASQPIRERFEASKQDSWVSTNRTPFMTALPTFERFANWIRVSWASANLTPAGGHSKILNYSQPEYAIPEHQQIEKKQGGATHMWTIPSLKTQFLSISKSQSFHNGNALIWTFRNLNKRFMSISKFRDCTTHFWTIRILNTWLLSICKSTTQQGGTTHIWTFRSLETRFLRIRISKKIYNGTAHIWMIRSLKRDSWASSNRPHIRAAQPICERFQASKHDSWVLENRSLFKTAVPIYERYKTRIRDSRASTNQQYCGTSPLISVGLTSWKHDFWEIGNSNSLLDSIDHCQRFVPWKPHSWASANRPNSRKVLHLSQGLQPENAIPHNQKIDLVAVRHSP